MRQVIEKNFKMQWDVLQERPEYRGRVFVLNFAEASPITRADGVTFILGQQDQDSASTSSSTRSSLSRAAKIAKAVLKYGSSRQIPVVGSMYAAAQQIFPEASTFTYVNSDILFLGSTLIATADRLVELAAAARKRREEDQLSTATRAAVADGRQMQEKEKENNLVSGALPGVAAAPQSSATTSEHSGPAAGPFSERFLAVGRRRDFGWRLS